MKSYLVILVSVMLISVLILSACSSAAPSSNSSTTISTTTKSSTTSVPATSTPVRTIKFAYSMPSGKSVARGFDWFGPAFEKATNGRYKVEIYPGTSLVAVRSEYDTTKSGAVEMNYTSIGTYPKQFPLSMVTQIPSLGFPKDSVKMAIASRDAFWEFFRTTPEIRNEFKEVTFIQPVIIAPYILVSKKVQIKSAADFKGLKVGGSGARMEMVVANGGAKIQQIPPDAYLNMDKGVTDACFVTFGQVDDYKLYGIADFFLNQDFSSATGIIIVNNTFYNSIGAADQKILLDTWDKAQEVSAQGDIEDVLAGKKDITAAGKSIYTPTAAEAAAWDSQVTPAINSWRNDAKTMGASDDILDAVLAKWKTIRAKYLAIGMAP
jgi:TRAP-type C4-dicarboxylate transport system substrate-binding protein